MRLPLFIVKSNQRLPKGVEAIGINDQTINGGKREAPGRDGATTSMHCRPATPIFIFSPQFNKLVRSKKEPGSNISHPAKERPHRRRLAQLDRPPSIVNSAAQKDRLTSIRIA